MKSKKEISKPVGVYGGETSGANPLEWNLRSTICSQLRVAGYFCEVDSFGDKSASWINIYKQNINEVRQKPGKVLSLVISFNYEGSIITEIKMYEENFFLQTGGTSGVW
jgi:hypothetical protein